MSPAFLFVPIASGSLSLDEDATGVVFLFVPIASGSLSLAEDATGGVVCSHARKCQGTAPQSKLFKTRTATKLNYLSGSHLFLHTAHRLRHAY